MLRCRMAVFWLVNLTNLRTPCPHNDSTALLIQSRNLDILLTIPPQEERLCDTQSQNKVVGHLVNVH